MKLFRISFCWMTPIPIKIIYKGEERIETDTNIIVKAKTHKEVLDNLKGTDAKTISNINSIIKC